MPYRVPINAPASVRIENKNLREFGIELESYPSNLLFPPVRERRVTTYSRPGSVDLGGVYDDWPFSIDCGLHASDHADAVTKMDDFKRWIDLAQHYASPWLVGQTSVKALKFELCGHRYYYTEGTVAVTNGNPVITGTGTYFLFYIKPGVEFRIQSDDTRYTVRSVESNTSLTLTANVGSSTDSGLTYQAERRRYLLVNYDGTSAIEEYVRDHFKDAQYHITVGFIAAYPFWVGDEFEITYSNVSAGDFEKLRGVGTTAHAPTYQIIGPSTSPEIVTADYAFHCRFHITTNYRDIKNLNDLEANISP